MSDLDKLQDKYRVARNELIGLQVQMANATGKTLRKLFREQRELQGRVDTLYQKIRFAVSNEAYKLRGVRKAKEIVE